MSDTNERSVASAGSVADEPVAWIAVFDGDDADGEFVWPDKGRAIEWASTRPGVRIAPLYLQPQPTLTDAEREAVKSAIWDYEQNDDDDGCASMVATLRGLLERMK